MAGSTFEGPGRENREKTFLFGLMRFEPRLAVALIFLTLIFAVVAVRMSRDTSLLRVDALAKEALRIHRGPEGQGAPPLDPAEVEARVREATGAKLVLPRDVEGFAFTGVTRGKVGKQPAAAVHLTFSGNSYLLLVVRREQRVGGGDLVPPAGFLSGEREGKSFVYWEKEGASLFLVTSADLTSTFDLVRRYFS
jgi:hypothetical protein